MPKMAASAPPELKQLFERHTRETNGQIERLQRCLKRFDSRAARAPKPQVIAAALAEMQEKLAGEMDPELAAVVVGAGARLIEHIEIGCYADLVTVAKVLRFDEDARLLEETLQEERRMEKELAGLAENTVEEAA